MFNMNKIGKTIKEARTKKNMTQLELADRMGVSYQAVSNWERGNSMPDIAKIPDLARQLDLDVKELLGDEDGQVTEAVRKTIDEPEAPLSVEELAEVAPILPPEDLKEKTEKTVQNEKIDLKALIPLAPFLDDEYMEELIKSADLSDMDGIFEIAPFLSDKALDDLVTKMNINDDFSDIAGLAPFLSDKALDDIADRLINEGKTSGLAELAPFLSGDSIRRIAEVLLRNKDIEGLSQIKVFL